MNIFDFSKKEDIEKAVAMLVEGKIGILPTDTIYGLHGRALDEKTVERSYTIKKRRPDKPFIILINSEKELELFGIKPSRFQREFLAKCWPGPVSVIFSCENKKLGYLLVGKNSLAFRVPDNERLLKILEKTGPLVSTSANPEGKAPAENITKAMSYFGSEVDFYLDGGETSGNSSTLVDLRENKVEIRRGKL